MNREALVLNADFIPLHFVPLSTVSWQEAMILMYQNKATAIEYYDDYVKTPTKEFRLPSVLVLREYKYFKKIAKLTKFNLKLRDEFVCGYCNKTFSHKSLTIDHVVPKSNGGKFAWSNLVAACKPCNQRKKNTFLKPKNKLYRPTYYNLAKKLVRYKSITNNEWKRYIRIH